tara:strand:- start:14493 stop:15740 length:1248 start_codon:yes stop_codon:yes gene_type:complete
MCLKSINLYSQKIMSKINKANVLNVLILIFALFPIIPNSVKGLPVILLFAAALFFFKKHKINWKWIFINSSLFIVYAISVLYTNDYSVAFKKLETGLSILVIPITFFALMTPFKASNNLKQVFMKTFIGSTTVFSIFSFTYIIFRKSSLDYIWNTDKYRNIIIDMPLIGHHPIYASIFLALSVIFVFYLFKQKQLKNYKEILLFLTLTLINLVLLLFLSSKGAILALFIIIFFLLLLTSINKTYKYLIIVTFVFSLITLFIYNRRMNELVSAQTYEEFNPTLSTSIRLGIYDCSWTIITKQLFTGYGVGDAQRELNLCYANKSDLLLMHRYNSHNQYLDVMIKTGLIGLIIFLGFLLINFRDAIKNRNLLLVMILVLYCILFLVENVLSRQSGVILFFFLICFFNNSKQPVLKSI